MNKLYYTLILMFLGLGSMQAQNTLKGGLSYTRFNIDGQQGIGYYTEYNRQLSPMISLAPSLQIAYGSKGREFPYYLLSKLSIGLDVNALYRIIHSNRMVLRAGLGPSMHYFSGRNLADFTIADATSIGGLGPDGTYSVPLFHPKERLQPTYLAIGYSAIVENEWSLSTHLVSGIRASYQGYSSADKIVSIGLNIGYRF